MGTVNVAGVTYSNPKQIDQTTNIDPLTGQVWKTSPFPASGTIGNRPNGTQLMGAGGPQPGTFDATPPTAPPLQFNKASVPASDPSIGGKAIPGTSGLSFKNPA